MTIQTRAKHLVGTAGNIAYYKPKDGNIIGQKTEVKVDKIDRTQENMHDFARAASGAKLIRKALATIISDIKDFHFGRRLNIEMHKIVKSDTVNPRGHRNISDGDIGLLQGFDVNTEVAFATAFNAPVVAYINRTTGLMKVDFPSLVNASLIERPEEATHLRLSIAGASINFNTGDHLVEQKAGEHSLISSEGVNVSSLAVQLPPACTATLILALGVSFYQEENGQFSVIGNGLYNAAAFVAVSGS